MESSKDLCAKYYQVNKQTTAKKPSESCQKLSKEEQSDNMVVNDIKISEDEK